MRLADEQETLLEAREILKQRKEKRRQRHVPKENNGVCEICHQSCRIRKDHNHKTGMSRGTLCRNCNTGIGMLGDNPDRLRSAALYLEKYDS